MNTFKMSPLATSVALVLGFGMQMPVFAEQEADITEQAAKKDIEVVEVSGIRGSLIRSMDVKRSSSGVVDAISAEEMGKFPDTNLAESLQRITGVSISRENGEGSKITVRGFGPEFNLITLNGRQMPGTGFTRSYALENLSSEGVSSLVVAKTASADLPSGGLGATVDIQTTKPLASPGQQGSVMVKAMHDTSNEVGENITPEIAGVYSNTFMDDQFGVAVSFSHSRRDFQRQQANIQGWQLQAGLPELDDANIVDARIRDIDGNPMGPAFFPKDMNFGIDDVQRERNNGQLTLQYAPNEDMTFTADYTLTQATVGINSFGWGVWNNFGGNINGYELDANGTAIYADISGDDGSFTANRVTTDVDAHSIGFNFEWQVNDVFHTEFDYHDSSNEIDNGGDKGLGGSGQIILGSSQLINKIYDYRAGDIPGVTVNWNNGTNMLNASEIDSNFSQFIYSPGESNVEQAQLHNTWINDVFEVPLMEVKFGASYTKQTMSGLTAWSGLRGGPGFNPSFTEIFPDGMFTLNSTNDMLDQFAGGGSGLNPNYYYTFSFEEALARQAAYLTADVVGEANAYIVDPFFDGIDSESELEEATTSFYVQTTWEFEVADYPVYLNAGLRYEQTDVTSRVRQKVPVQVNWVSESEWITQYAPGDDTFFVEEGDHDVLLPNLDIKVELSDDLVARASWGKSISRAPLGSLGGGLALSGSPKIGARTGGGGNPNLLPFEATNFDLTLEYYYSEDSYAAIGYFTKDVDNFISSQSTTETFDGLRDIYLGPRYLEAQQQLIDAGDANPDTGAIYQQMIANGHGDESGAIQPSSDDPLIEWLITKPFNSDSKSVNGIEMAVQHVFGDSGFGLGVNATLVDGDIEFDPLNLEPQSPLNGLSDSANFQAFYEKDGLSVKLTYAWRDAYLIGIGQSQGSSDAPPQFAKTFGQWDMSINYDVTEDMTVFFEGVNLNNETEQGYGRYKEQFLFARQYGPRYGVGMRYKF